jgi:hypothetical protein
MNSPLEPQHDYGPPVDEHPDDPDRDFDEKNKDYLDYIIAKLVSARTQTGMAQELATKIIAKAQEQERDLWLSYESYLTIGAKRRQQESGSGDLHKPSGALLWIEEPGDIEIDDAGSLETWVQTQLRALLDLAAALQSHRVSSPSNDESSSLDEEPEQKSDLTDSQMADHPEVTRVPLFPAPFPSSPAHPVPEAPRDQPTVEPILAAVRTFHHRTQLLPAGCHISPPQHVLRLQ